jgi:hypothetical protein
MITIGIESMYAVAMPVTADLVARARIAVGGVRRALLVPDEDVLDLVLLEQLVVDEQHRAAGVAEDDLDPLFLQAAHDDLGARQLDFGGPQFHSGSLNFSSGKFCRVNASI